MSLHSLSLAAADLFEGEIKKPQRIDIDTLLKWFPLEERVYRHRCVEAWAMTVPWSGFPLRALVELASPPLQRPGQ